MFELPSISSIAVSVVAFFVAAWYLRRYLDEQGIPKGMTRTILIFTLAYLASWASGAAVDWMQGNTVEPQPVTQSTDDLRQMLQPVDQPQR